MEPRNNPNGMGRPTARRASAGGRQPRSETQSASTGLDAPGSSRGDHRAAMTSSRATSICRGMIDGRRDPRLHRQKRGRQVAQRILRPPLPCPRAPPSQRAQTGRARFSRSRNATRRRRMAIWALVDQHPTMRRANAALGQEPARPTIAVMASGPIGVETGETDGRGRPRHDGPRRRRTTIQKPGKRPSGMPLRQRHAAQSRGIDGASPRPKRDLVRARRNIVDRRSRRVEGIVGGGKAGRQGRRIQTVSAGDATEPRRQRFVAKGTRRDGKTPRAHQRRAACDPGRPARRSAACVIETSGRMRSSPAKLSQIEPFLARPDRRHGRRLDQPKNPRGDAVGQGQDALANRGAYPGQTASARGRIDARLLSSRANVGPSLQGLRGKASKRSASWASVSRA